MYCQSADAGRVQRLLLIGSSSRHDESCRKKSPHKMLVTTIVPGFVAQRHNCRMQNTRVTGGVLILFTPMVVRNGRSHGVKCASLRFLRSFEQRDVAKFQVQMSSMPSIQGWPRLLQDQQTPIDLASLVSLVASSGQAPTTG